GYGVDFSAADMWSIPPLPVLERVSPDPVMYQIERDYTSAITNSLLGDTTAPITAVDLQLEDPASSTTGCQPEDFDGFTTRTSAVLGETTAPSTAVARQPEEPASSTSGCEPEDFEGFTTGNIALVQRGSCAFAIKGQNALDAGASAILIGNSGTEGNTAPAPF